MNKSVASLPTVLTLAESVTSAFGGEDSQVAASASKSVISEESALAIAKTRFPNSAFEGAELEKENGRRIWSIDLRPNGSNNVQEVHVDAFTGSLLETEVESP